MTPLNDNINIEHILNMKLEEYIVILALTLYRSRTLLYRFYYHLLPALHIYWKILDTLLSVLAFMGEFSLKSIKI